MKAIVLPMASELPATRMPPTQSMATMPMFTVRAMAGPKRSASMPDLATFAEQGVANVDLAVWVGAYAPPKTPKRLVSRLQKELKAVLRQPDVRKKLLALGQTPIGNTPEEFAQNQRMDTLKWDALVRVFDIKIE